MSQPSEAEVFKALRAKVRHKPMRWPRGEFCLSCGRRAPCGDRLAAAAVLAATGDAWEATLLSDGTPP
ncbi:MAG TPA: hypothetical protein VGR21_08650 [Cryptosporangiaceae bacterium]|nr:hypothetical protein [Cryptosporangiaceae bacterium]